MTTQARCPVCGQTMAVRTSDRLPAHWWSELEKRHREPQCEGSQMGTRFWPTGPDGVRYQKPHRT